jgi:serine phosphatase RsbU (regulator of sigma subunit)
MQSLAASTGNAIRALDILGTPTSPWEEELCQAFVSDVWSAGDEFLRQLRDLLRGVSAQGEDVGGFHRVISTLRTMCPRSLALGSPQQTRAETLLHAAGVAIGGAGERAQSKRQVLFEEFAYRLTRTNSALGRAVDLAGISAVLAAELPAYGFEACYVCDYEPDQSPRRSRVLAGFGLAAHEKPSSFPSERLMPDIAFGGGAPMRYLVGPLVRGTSTGYAAFAYGPDEGFVYEILFDQLGSALARLSLTSRLMREAALREAAERARLEREFAIAAHIQSAMLPKNFRAHGLEIAALTQPSTEVGGDYYDVLDTADGCWIGIGDVAGHGLPTGLVMLMLQSVVSGLLRANPSASPREVLLEVNAALYENIRMRMRQDEFVTLTLIHCHGDGRLTFAGAHEDMLVYRAATEGCEWIATPGTWVGARSDIADATVDTSNRLDSGDVLVLFTDGITEARNAAGEFFGQERLAEIVLREASRGASVEAIRDAVLADLTSFAAYQSDDFSVLVACRHPEAAT